MYNYNIIGEQSCSIFTLLYFKGGDKFVNKHK